MTDLHPHWQSTADDDVPVHSAASPSAVSPVRVSVKSASRLPGAIVGIAVFAVVGFTLAGGWNAMNLASLTSWLSITAQVSGGSSSPAPAAPTAPLPPVEIHITPTSGFNPEKATVHPGQRIVWVNDQSIPHIITSQTLRDGSGKFLNTPAIFPGGRESFVVGKAETDKEHRITSATDQDLQGTVIVSTAREVSSSSSKAFGGGTDGVVLPSGQGSSKKSSSKSPSKSVKSSKSSSKSSGAAAGSTTSGAGAAPVYPSSQNGQPTSLDSYGSPLSGNVPGYAQNAYPPVTPEPMEQPHTGPGLWAVCAMSIAVLWGLTRKYFMRIE
ncbi:hypothetical protein EXS70_00620 [Candidatus Peribacteria bacterium]|nr:hypothetical protein [Candidatus Peribacteria bacterium]